MKKLILIIILFFGAFLRFYKLDWGEGNFFHPDERNIAWAVGNISFPNQMNPKFFAYGGFPLYLYYFTGFLLSKVSPSFIWPSFNNAIFIGRFWSAVFSTLTIIVFLFLAKKFLKEMSALLATFLLAILPGAFQQAHFATVESLLSFFLISILYLTILFLGTRRLIFIFLASIFCGLSIGTKIVSLTFLPIIFLPLFANFSKPFSLRIFSLLLGYFLIFGFIIFFFFTLSSPYTFLDWPGFKNSMNYETGVGVGNPLAFYTRQFINTIPVVFQLTHIFPYALGPLVEIFGILGFLIFLISFFIKPDFRFFLVLTAFLSYLLPNIAFFAKWTRFMAPIFFFFPFFTGYFLSLFSRKNLQTSLSLLIFLPTFLWGLAFFTIYLRKDVRLVASDWLIQNLPPSSYLLFETGNVIDIPLEGNFPRNSFDFFHIDQDSKQDELFSSLEKADYFLIQSRRVWANYTRLPTTHPTTVKFYSLLWSGKLGFERIKEFDSFPQIFGFKINDELAEETFTVFDHPHITIWKKTKYFTKDDYFEFFNTQIPHTVVR